MMSDEILQRQREHFSTEKSAHISFDERDTQDYIDKAEKAYHDFRRDNFWKEYKINYRNRHVDQKNLRKGDID